MYFEGDSAVHKMLRRIAHRLDEIGVDYQDLIRVRSLPRELAEQLHPSLRETYLRKWDDAQRAAQDEH